MVDDRITDGKRIAQLLSSELSGRETGPLADVAVADADRSAEPSDEGAVAYRVTYRGERVGTVRIYPEAVDFETADDSSLAPDAVVERARDAGLSVSEADGGATVRVESGAAVKRAVDALVAGLETGE